jgi:hypothetical protein
LKVRKKPGDRRYTIINREIKQVTLLKYENKKWLCKIEGYNKPIYIRGKHIYKTEHIAGLTINRILEHEILMKEIEEEEKEKEIIALKIFDEFDVKIPLVSWVWMEKSELEEIYNNLKEENEDVKEVG